MRNFTKFFTVKETNTLIHRQMLLFCNILKVTAKDEWKILIIRCPDYLCWDFQILHNAIRNNFQVLPK